MSAVKLLVTTKSVNDEQRIIEGWATRPEEDRVGDTVLPKGAVFSLPIPFLLDHDHSKAVGEVDRVEITDKGIRFWAHIKKIAEEGEVKDMCDAAWGLVKNGLRKSVSIGFLALEFEPKPNRRGLTISKWNWLELSAVSIPALASASITSIKNAGDLCYSVAPTIHKEQAPAKGAALHIDAEKFGEAVGIAIRESIAPLNKRIADLEVRVAAAQKGERRGLAFKGAFQRALPYCEGDLVTQGNRAYIAVRNIPAGQHLRDGVEGWVLMFKEGQQ